MSLLQSRTRSAAEGFGKPVRRVEDARLIIGNGRFSDDFNAPGQAYACFVRSPHAPARLVRIEGAAPPKRPRVNPGLTRAPAAADGPQPIPHPPLPAHPSEPP